MKQNILYVAIVAALVGGVAVTDWFLVSGPIKFEKTTVWFLGVALETFGVALLVLDLYGTRRELGLFLNSVKEEPMPRYPARKDSVERFNIGQDRSLADRVQLLEEYALGIDQRVDQAVEDLRDDVQRNVTRLVSTERSY